MTTLTDLCPQCGSDDYGPLDIAWPFGLPEHNPNPNVSYVVGVCCACEHVEDDAAHTPALAAARTAEAGEGQ